jgi:hypothetical protein
MTDRSREFLHKLADLMKEYKVSFDLVERDGDGWSSTTEMDIEFASSAEGAFESFSFIWGFDGCDILDMLEKNND